jgi:TusA-related sulfurtransferase
MANRALALAGAAAFAAAASGGILHAKDTSQPVSVLVRASGESGFSAPGVADSIKDLKNSLKGKKLVILTDDPAAAEIVIEVLGRFKDFRGETYSTATAVNDNTATVKTTQKKSAVVAAKLIVGDYSTELVGEAGGVGRFGFGAWGDAANQIAKQIEDFIKENNAQLLAKRTARN